jgi:toxin CcdB
VTQFAAFENPNRDTRKAYPFLLDIQSDLIQDLTSTIVIPLAPKRAMSKPISRLNPTVSINGTIYVVLTQQISGYARSALGKPVADLSQERYALIAAIDFVISGI